MSTSPDAAQPPRKPKGRSPGFPAVDLQTAIGRARQLYEVDRQHLVPVETIAQHWGYKSLNGPASLTLAALKKFGLISDEGVGAARRARVTDLAVNIIGNPVEPERQAATRAAALNPAIHREMWDKYGATLPSDANLEWELTRERGFTQGGAREFIKNFRATVAFAQLADGGTVAAQTPEVSEVQQDDDDATGGDRYMPPPGRRSVQRVRRMSEPAGAVYTIPLPGRAPVIVEGEFPVTEQQWAQFMAVLNAMKPGLVSEDQPDDAFGE